MNVFEKRCSRLQPIDISEFFPQNERIQDTGSCNFFLSTAPRIFVERKKLMRRMKLVQMNFARIIFF